MHRYELSKRQATLRFCPTYDWTNHPGAARHPSLAKEGTISPLFVQAGKRELNGDNAAG
jgi:hypothetical protein